MSESQNEVTDGSVLYRDADHDESPISVKRQREDDDVEDRNDEDEDDDEEDEDDEEEEEFTKKRKRRRANQFLDIEAEVDDEEEDELDEDDEEAELLREQFISDDKHHGGDEDGTADDRLHRQYDQRRQEAEDQDAEKLAETLKQRYRKTHSVYRGDTTASGTVSQKLLMPSINDPPIYGIRCLPGREKDLVRKLYEKKRTLANTPNRLDILTVFQRDLFKGYIYIEAKRPEAIDKALTGMVNVYAKQRILVPVKEYPDLLKQVKSLDIELVPGIYVRITRGKYKGDLAIVDNLSENGLDVRCKVVPRLDYGKNDDYDESGKRIKLKIRPLPRLFNEQEARMYDGEHVQPGRGHRAFIYRNEEYNEGFLFKDFKLNFIETKDVHPRLEELDRFQTGNEEDGLDLSAIAASLKNKKTDGSEASAAFQPEDKVEIRRGEQAKTIGRVVTTSLNEVTIIVTDSGDPKFVNQKLTVPANDLRKVFTAGDHVRVIEGKHTDETGLVIKIDNDSVVLLSDQTNEDVRVFANYLIKATDSSSTAVALENTAGYDLKDLVQINALTVGCIVKADKGIFQVLSQDGRLLLLRPSGIASKMELTRREQFSTDKTGSTINIGDTVKESLGDDKREGTIIHIYKNTLFIQLKEIIANLGIFVTNNLNVSTVTTKGLMILKNLGPDLNKMNPNLNLPPPNLQLNSRGKGGRDKIMGQNVVVTSGNYKGLMGKVVDSDDVFCRIELHTKLKRIKVRKDSISILLRGESIPYLRFIGAQRGANNSNNGGPRGNNSGPSFASTGGSSTWGGSSSWNNSKSRTAYGNAGSTSVWGNAQGAGGATPSIAAGASTWKNSNNAGTSTWGKTPGNAGAGSTWGSSDRNNGGANSTWGASAGGNSSWGSGNGSKTGGAGGNSTWGSGGAGGAGGAGGNSTWGAGAGNSTWGSGAGNSTWGSSGGNSTWGNKDGKSKWGGNSAWGSK